MQITQRGQENGRVVPLRICSTARGSLQSVRTPIRAFGTQADAHHRAGTPDDCPQSHPRGTCASGTPRGFQHRRLEPRASSGNSARAHIAPWAGASPIKIAVRDCDNVTPAHGAAVHYTMRSPCSSTQARASAAGRPTRPQGHRPRLQRETALVGAHQAPAWCRTARHEPANKRVHLECAQESATENTFLRPRACLCNIRREWFNLIALLVLNITVPHWGAHKLITAHHSHTQTSQRTKCNANYRNGALGFERIHDTVYLGTAKGVTLARSCRHHCRAPST